MIVNHYGVVPPNGTIAVNMRPPLEDGETVSVLALPPNYVTVQIMNADSIVVANSHPKWPIVFALVRVKGQLP